MSSADTGVLVVGLDLTDVDDADSANPLSGILLNLACSAARLSQSQTQSLGAVTALDELQRTVTLGIPGVAPGMPDFAELIGHLQELLGVARDLTSRSGVVTSGD